MYFRHNVDDTIEINGVKFEYETFLSVEPNYTKPIGMAWRHYEQGSHHQLHTVDGSQTSGEYPWADGDRYISRLGDFKMMQQEEKEDTKIVSSKIEETIKSCDIEDVDPQQKLKAMWDHLVMNQPRETTIDPLIKILNKNNDKDTTVFDPTKNQYEDLL